jgi:hypothetical protein
MTGEGGERNRAGAFVDLTFFQTDRAKTPALLCVRLLARRKMVRRTRGDTSASFGPADAFPMYTREGRQFCAENFRGPLGGVI